ncbi:MAG: galactose mutarotase [Bacteroidales bacterium]|nr:galactose mutarotase [Bacteroidales bacterium]
MLSGCLIGATLLSSSCSNQCSKTFVDPVKFDSTIDGQKTGLYFLKNTKGTVAAITNFGGRLVSFSINDKNGEAKDVVLGFDNVASYVSVPSDFGASIGRYANRIDSSRYVLNGDTVKLESNDGVNCLHGGFKGWQYKIYEVKEVNDQSITLVYNSPDGDGLFPGNVVATVKYTLTENNELEIDYSATTDKSTVINMTNHSYFNLNGDPNMTINNCHLYINSDNYTPINDHMIPTGEIAPVAGTPFDLNTMAEIGDKIDNMSDPQVKTGNGFDHNWCLNTYNDETKGDASVIAASLYSPLTGIQLDVYTNEPGIQCYSGNFLDGTVTGKAGIVYKKHAGICLETQKYPNSPNMTEWPTATLNPGETYHSYCKFAFSVKK